MKPESRKICHTSVLSEQQRPCRAFNSAIELENKATKAGFLASAGVAAGDRSREHMQQSLLAWYRESIAEMLPLDEAVRLSMAFGRGYSTMDKRLSGFIPLVLDGTASVVITASNEEKTLPEVISQLRRLPFHEIIVVLNGCTDGSYEAVEDHPSIIKLNYPDRLGHDVGRAIGATAATGDIILFTDGDLPLPAEELAPFIIAINGGDDVALNDLSPYLPPFADQDEVSRSKTFLNQCLGRGDLKANSMTAVPHALSRKAINTIGLASLIVPPKAQALALVYGLKVRAPYTVDVIRNNRIRSSNTGAGNKVARLITGDHIEAFSEVMNVAGIRLAYMTLPRSELARRRNAL
ncbi:Glycosyl transferase family 2 [compost metagenome]